MANTFKSKDIVNRQCRLLAATCTTEPCVHDLYFAKFGTLAPHCPYISNANQHYANRKWLFLAVNMSRMWSRFMKWKELVLLTVLHCSRLVCTWLINWYCCWFPNGKWCMLDCQECQSWCLWSNRSGCERLSTSHRAVIHLWTLPISIS